MENSHIINKNTLSLLNRVSENWNTLSMNPEEYGAMVDHCHIDNDELDCLIMDIEKALQKGSK